MQQVGRRQFIKMCASSALALGLTGFFTPELERVFAAAAKGEPAVLWLQGGGCSACTNSVLNSVHPSFKELLAEIIALEYHANILGENLANPLEQLYAVAKAKQGQFLLVVEGAIPTAQNGTYCLAGSRQDGKRVTFQELVEQLGNMAKGVIAIGTCAAYGGLPSAKPNPTKAQGVNSLINPDKVINVPGCPTHPDWVIGTLAHMLLYSQPPEVDDFGRPKVFFGGTVHDNCPRRQYFDNSTFAEQFGEAGCLLQLGCKGPLTFADCTTRLWNGGTNFCLNAGAPCLGCTHPNYPDETSPFYRRMGNVSVPGINVTADTIGKIAGAATAVGLAGHLAASAAKGRLRVRGSKDGVGHE